MFTQRARPRPLQYFFFGIFPPRFSDLFPGQKHGQFLAIPHVSSPVSSTTRDTAQLSLSLSCSLAWNAAEQPATQTAEYVNTDLHINDQQTSRTADLLDKAEVCDHHNSWSLERTVQMHKSRIRFSISLHRCLLVILVLKWSRARAADHHPFKWRWLFSETKVSNEPGSDLHMCRTKCVAVSSPLADNLLYIVHML